jgi:elongation factor P--(R)-beta-lysine ligase
VNFDFEKQRFKRIKSNLELRARIFQLIRSFFSSRGFLEVETPIRMPEIAPEQYISPFDSEGWFLCTSPELHMKRLLSAGYDRLFQITRCFRKGESGKRHNPEFSILEWYHAGGDYQEMITETEALVNNISNSLGNGRSIPNPLGVIDLTPPWTRINIRDVFSNIAGWDPIASPNDDRFDTDLVTRVLPGLDPEHPVVLEHYPASMASLARLNPDDPRVAERAEIFIGGLEIANAYSELNDLQEQKIRFENELSLIQKVGGKASLPNHFLETISYLPGCGGIALGLDRLVMLFCGTDSIEDVIAFPADFI